jgi:hypothetical protein
MEALQVGLQESRAVAADASARLASAENRAAEALAEMAAAAAVDRATLEQGLATSVQRAAQAERALAACERERRESALAAAELRDLVERTGVMEARLESAGREAEVARQERLAAEAQLDDLKRQVI